MIVEGRDDASWLKWYFAEHGIDAKAFSVDDRVTVPGDLVSTVHTEINARGRVIALAVESEMWGLPQPSLTCIIDSDFDIFEPSQTAVSLLKTDYAAMEVYALTERPLSKFLIASAKADIQASSLTALLKPAWAILYALRYVLHRHGDGAKLAKKFADKCINNAGDLVVNASELLRSSQPSPSRDALSQLLGLHQEYMRAIPEASLHGIRGHDIAPIIIRFLKLKNELADPKVVEHLMRQSVELIDLDDQPMFQQLKSRIAN
ncbi:hypothetical protein [Nocardia sp. NPDC005998]|uniref:hypothetical protein n=1 Tax=Nocardia sp. NPDC005998 TaxID=3156894 RepID=UPI0033A35271